jgi:S-adenosyl-L-methionine hydrolase (adenosine-forming)
MAIVTLTSDWNKDDYYTASIKGKILSRCPGTTIIDITNQVPAFNISLAAFQLKHSFIHFPENTIHIIAVNNTSNEKSTFIALKYHNQFFVSYNNGMFGLLLDYEPDEMVIIDHKESGTFPELIVFAEAACELIESQNLSTLGSRCNELYKQIPVRPAIDESVINGSIIYIDSYKNAISNINREIFERIGKGRSFEIYVQSNHHHIDRLNSAYNESSPGELMALFNSFGLLEIAINGGNASNLLNLSLNSSIRVKFSDHKHKQNTKQ